MSEIEVRRLTPDDWAVERHLRLAALADAPDAFNSRLADAERFGEQEWRSRVAGQARFAAWLDGELAGTIGCAPAGESYPEGAQVLVGMWVHPSARGTGVADRLVSAVTDLVREEGSGEIWLAVTHGNIAAERLYARHGFRRVSEAGLTEEPQFEMRLLVGASPVTAP